MAFIQAIEKKTGKRYKVHYKDPVTGKRRSRVFKRAKDANHFVTEIPKRDYIHDSDTVTVAIAADKWLDVCEKIGRRGREPVEKATLKPYRLHTRYIKEIIGGRNLNELTPQVCEQFRTDLLERFSRVYARKILTSFKGIFDLPRVSRTPQIGAIMRRGGDEWEVDDTTRTSSRNRLFDWRWSRTTVFLR